LKPDAIQNPTDVLNRLVLAAAEVIRHRDPALGAALDAAPPPVAIVPPRQAQEATPEEVRGLAYRGVRKVYRGLKQVEALQPSLQRLRNVIRRDA
jgi:hypothetical protein